MHRYFLHMAFDGSAYHGWQKQPNGITVQQVLEEALSTLLKIELAVTGAGRTDAGVHASAFVAHFELPDPLPGDPGEFVFKVNRFLPEDIVVYRIVEVDSGMHARFSATYRTYHYHLSTVKPLFTRNYTHYVHAPLNLKEINRSCEFICSGSDFTSFSRLHTNVKTNICNVMQADWKIEELGYLFEIKADRFLRNMVRSLVGTLLEVGQGKLDSDGFRAILNARDRRKAGQSAPASALFLVDIGYDL